MTRQRSSRTGNPGSATARLVLACAALSLNAFAQSASAQVCGNGVREAGEECDDGNRASLDGCSANCRFEQIQRFDSLAIQSTTSVLCLSNALGSHAFTSFALSQFNTSIASSVADGSTSVLLYFAHGLADPTGTSAESPLQIGILDGVPLGVSASYDGTSDSDWWYDVDPIELGASQEPTTALVGSTAGGTLTVTPSASFVLRTILAGTPSSLSLSGVKLASALGPSSTPAPYTGDADRGHVAAENLDPALQSFATLDGSVAGAGLCGNVSAASLAQTPVPPSLRAGSISACTQGYTDMNSLLDVIVGKCTISVITAINATQPDTTDPDAPPAGNGGPYKLIANADHVVTTCEDNTNAPVDLATCLHAAAYSSFFSFKTDRVIVKSSGAADVIFHDQFDVFP